MNIIPQILPIRLMEWKATNLKSFVPIFSEKTGLWMSRLLQVPEIKALILLPLKTAFAMPFSVRIIRPRLAIHQSKKSVLERCIISATLVLL